MFSQMILNSRDFPPNCTPHKSHWCSSASCATTHKSGLPDTGRRQNMPHPNWWEERHDSARSYFTIWYLLLLWTLHGFPKHKKTWFQFYATQGLGVLKMSEKHNYIILKLWRFSKKNVIYCLKRIETRKTFGQKLWGKNWMHNRIKKE